MDPKASSLVDRLMESVKKDGVAVGTVSDGYIVVFDKDTLQQLVDMNEDSEQLVIFVKTREGMN